jgi:hypothetical protein
LFIVSLLIIGFGLSFAAASGTSMPDPMNRLVEPAFRVGQCRRRRLFPRMDLRLDGATMAGWGVFLENVANLPFRCRERWVWNCFVLGILAR